MQAVMTVRSIVHLDRTVPQQSVNYGPELLTVVFELQQHVQCQLSTASADAFTQKRVVCFRNLGFHGLKINMLLQGGHYCYRKEHLEILYKIEIRNLTFGT